MYDIDPIKIVAGAGKSAPTTTDNTLAQNKSVVNSIISKNSENDTEMRKSVNDSNGKKLSEQQAEYFKDSKVRDEEGNLLVVYHGTRKADFTVFNRNYNFFTDNKNTAESYAPESEMFEGYLNISKPYIIDAKDNKWSAIPVDEETKTMLDNYGSSTFKENGQWMTSPADIVAAILDGIDEGEFYYDGVIIKNVEDTGNWGENEKTIGNDYIVFNSNQFKNIDNLNPTENEDIRFSKNTKYNEFKTFSMQWANSADTKDGDMKIFNRRGKEFVLLEKSGNDIIEVAKGSYRKVRNIYEQTYRTSVDKLHDYSEDIRGGKRNDTWDKFDVGDRGYDAGNGGQTGSEGFQTDGEGNGTDLLSGDKGELRKSLNNTEMI